MMRCIICEDKMKYFFTKKFQYQDLDLRDVKYYKCINCGFTSSKTHYEMDESEWEIINNTCHTMHNDNNSVYNSSQRWFQQALMLNLLSHHHIIPSNNWLDYASGEGNLSIQLEKHFSKKLWNYDKYMTPKSNVIPKEMLKEKFNVVVNGAFFEHVRTREHLNEVNNFVSDSGVLAMHTLVREEIPNDPDWFYLLPVHTSFHTNKSMQILMDQWNYTCSIYNEHSQLWIMFKSEPKDILEKVENLNALMGWDYLKFKVGFMDYWK